jgi:site-specific recombinase XerC
MTETNRLYEAGLEGLTNAAYRRHFRKYVDWAADNGVARNGVLPRPTEEDLMVFAQFLQRKLGAGAVNSTLSGVAAGFIERGMKSVVKDKYGVFLPRLRRLIRGIKKLKGKPPAKRLALTVDKLRKLLSEILDACGRSAYDAAALEAALTMGVYLLMRVSEFTSPKVKEHDPERHLNAADVQVLPSLDNPQWMEVEIKASKTDCFREGITLKVYANGDRTCPVAAMARWLRVRASSGHDQPLFVLSDGTFLTRARLQRVLKLGIKAAGYDPKHWSTHSLRIGGASTLAAQGWPAETIMLLGRWSSECYLRYLRMNDHRRRDISRSMSQVSTEVLDLARARGTVGAGDRWAGRAEN